MLNPSIRVFGRSGLLAAVVVLVLASDVKAEDWQQFRGPRSSGLSRSNRSLPVELSKSSLIVWKTPTAPGHSSPVVSQDRIFMTGAEGEKLFTFALDRATGKKLWQVEAPHDKLEEIHKTGSYAQSSPATDGEIVVSFFGSSGLFAYDKNGVPLWSHRMGPFKNDFGAGSSPIIDGERVILLQDHDVESFIAAYDKKTGKELWRTDRSEFTRNYSTPVIWEVNGKKQIVVSATLRVIGYDFETGSEVWTVRGVSRIVNMSPIVGPDNVLYVATFSPGNDSDNRVTPLRVEELFAADADGNGTIEESEFPDHPFKTRFTQIDRDKDGHITKDEYQSVARQHSDGKNVFLAVSPGGRGDVTKTHVRWEQTKQFPYCPSPLYYDGRLYMVKDGGIFSVLDAATGKVLKHVRLKATGNYYASPVGGDGKVYLINQLGVMTIVSTETGWKELHTVDLEGDGHATPAIADGRIYARVGDQLYCFGLGEKTANAK